MIDLLGVLNHVPAATHAPYIFWYLAVAHILTHSENLSFGVNRASKVNVGLGPGSGFKMRPFTALCFKHL